jgi:hypothetical protein
LGPGSTLDAVPEVQSPEAMVRANGQGKKFYSAKCIKLAMGLEIGVVSAGE